MAAFPGYISSLRLKPTLGTHFGGLESCATAYQYLEPLRLRCAALRADSLAEFDCLCPLYGLFQPLVSSSKSKVHKRSFRP